VVAASLITACNTNKPAKSGLSRVEARSIAREAYIYGVSMVAQYKTMYAYSIDKGGRQYMGPFDSILNIARVFTPEDTAFVTPNSDTPYSFAGLDLRAEPAIITIPKMEKLEQEPGTGKRAELATRAGRDFLLHFARVLAGRYGAQWELEEAADGG
jgi:hypothetical protein